MKISNNFKFLEIFPSFIWKNPIIYLRSEFFLGNFEQILKLLDLLLVHGGEIGEILGNYGRKELFEARGQLSFEFALEIARIEGQEADFFDTGEDFLGIGAILDVQFSNNFANIVILIFRKLVLEPENFLFLGRDLQFEDFYLVFGISEGFLEEIFTAILVNLWGFFQMKGSFWVLKNLIWRQGSQK